MKKYTITAMALTGLMSSAAVAQSANTAIQHPTHYTPPGSFAAESGVGSILEGMNMFTPGEGDRAYKVKANEKYGSQWAVDLAYGLWNAEKAEGVNRHTNLGLLHMQLNQRLIENKREGGTWVLVELSVSCALDRESAQSDTFFTGGYATASGLHADAFGPHDAFFPEVALMHYFAGKRACLIAGMVNLTNYFDAVGIANDSFHSFTNDGFVNSTILPLTDSNLGAVLQVELNRKSYFMVGVSRTGCEPGYNPFNAESINGYAVVGEFGHTFADGAATLRLNPFFTQADVDAGDGRGERSRRNAGLVGSIEYAPCELMTVYSRAGFAAKQDLGNAAEFSVGANVKLFPSRENDFFGISYGVFKGQTPTEHRREHVLEAMYSLQVNDYFKVVPHVQYISNPAYSRSNTDILWGVQGVWSF